MAATAVDYSQPIAAAEQANGIPAGLLQRQLALESGNFDTAVVFGTQRGSAGEIGIAQFLPSTAASVGVNPFDPIASIQAAARLMGSYLRQFGGDSAKALSAYNAGPGATQAAISAGGSDWQSHIPATTRGYISLITGSQPTAPGPASAGTASDGKIAGISIPGIKGIEDFTSAIGTAFNNVGNAAGNVGKLAGNVEAFLSPVAISHGLWRAGFTVAGVSMVGVGLALYFGGHDAGAAIIDAAKSAPEAAA